MIFIHVTYITLSVWDFKTLVRTLSSLLEQDRNLKAGGSRTIWRFTAFFVKLLLIFTLFAKSCHVYFDKFYAEQSVIFLCIVVYSPLYALLFAYVHKTAHQMCGSIYSTIWLVCRVNCMVFCTMKNLAIFPYFPPNERVNYSARLHPEILRLLKDKAHSERRKIIHTLETAIINYCLSKESFPELEVESG